MGIMNPSSSNPTCATIVPFVVLFLHKFGQKQQHTKLWGWVGVKEYTLFIRIYTCVEDTLICYDEADQGFELYEFPFEIPSSSIYFSWFIIRYL